MKVIIAGSRTVSNYEIVKKAILDSKFKITEVISGKAKGVDSLGEKWALENKVPIKEFPAKWDDLTVKNAIIKTNNYGQYNAAAGINRNIEMGNYADALIVIIQNNSKGSEHMYNYMKELNKPVYVVYV